MAVILSWVASMASSGHEHSTGSVSLLAVVLPIAAGASNYYVVTTMLYGLFLAAFWQNTKLTELLRPRALNVVALAVQAVSAALVSTELLYIVSAEVALVLPFRQGVVWLLSQGAVELGIYAWFAKQTGLFIYGLNHLPEMQFGWAMAILGWIVVTYNLIWYSLGFMAASQLRQTLDLRQANGALRATQQMEAETVRLAERLNLSRELHDSAGHHLVAITVNLQLALKQTQGPATRPIEEALASARMLLNEVRDVVSDLRDLKSLNLALSLRTLVEAIPTPAIHLDVDEAFERIEPLPGHTIFRCAQELLTNALKHSAARNVWLTLRLGERAYELIVRDDGQGSACVTFGNGLNGLRERAKELGGQFGVSARAGHGWEASLAIPRRDGKAVLAG